MQISRLSDRITTSALLVWGGALVVFTIWLQWWWAGTSMDIDVYWEAGQRMLNGGANLYGEPEDPANAVGIFIYPPLFAALYAPITLLPRWLGYALWGMLELGFIVAGLHFTRKLCGVEPGSKGRFFYLLMTAGLIGAIWTNLQEGQVNMLVVSALAGGLWQLERKQHVRGGLLLAVATHLKVIPIVLLPLLIAQKRFKAAAFMAGGVVLLWFTPLLFSIPNYGFSEGIAANTQLTTEYVDHVVSPRLSKQSAFSLGGSRAPNNSMTAVMRRWFSDGSKLSLNRGDRSPLWFEAPEPVYKWTGLGVGAILGGLAMLLAWRKRDDLIARSASIGLGVTAAALANLLFWPHHMCLLLLVLGPLAAAGIRDQKMTPMFAAVFGMMALCYLPLLDRVPVFDWMAVVGTPTFGVLAVWMLVFIHFWRRSVASAAEAPILRAHAEAETRNPVA